MPVKVTIVKSIQVRYEWSDSGGGAYSSRYIKPTAAAKEWARLKSQEWMQKVFKHRSMTSVDYELLDKREERYYRKALPIFRAMLK
jgi:hypothetical protein